MLLSKKIMISAITLPSATGGIYLSKSFLNKEGTSTQEKNPNTVTNKIESLPSKVPVEPTVTQSVPEPSPVVSSTLGETEVGTWTNPNPSSTIGGPEVMNAGDPKSACTIMYFIEDAKWKSNKELESFSKRTKFKKIEDLFTHKKLDVKGKQLANESIDHCSKKKSTLYIGMGLSEQLAGVVSSEPFTKH